MAEPLLTTRELALWTQKSEEKVAADPFATDVIDKVSELVDFLGGHDGTHLDASGVVIPEWTLDPGPTQAPFDVRMVVLQVCKRTYGNPNQVVQEGNVGPIGGDRVVDAAALLLDLTESERAVLTKYNADGDPDGADELWVLKTTKDPETTLQTSPLYVSDDQQVNIDSTNAAPSWDIPLYNPGDPGDDALYEGV